MIIAAFSKYLGYGVGGAERSLINHLKDVDRQSDVQIKIIYCEGIKAFSASKNHIIFPDSWQIIPIKCKTNFNRFFFYDYLINRCVLQFFFSDLKADVLYAQNLWAPTAINSFSGKTVRFIRDEYDLNIWGNYHTGCKKVAKAVYQKLQWLGYKRYCDDNTEAMKKTDEVIANSNYMAGQIKQIFGRDSKIKYPNIDLEDLCQRYDRCADDIPGKDKAVVMVGDSVVKGVRLFCEISKRFPDEKFMIFSRAVDTPKQKNNIIYMPWQKDPAEIYKYAKLVLVPSLWNEAYGRVAAEARSLDIDVIVSDKGGLGEAVDNDKNCIAEGFGDFIRKIKQFLQKNE